MDWSSYGSFLAFAVALVLVPGADFTVIVRNTLAGGAARGGWSAAGVSCSNAVQGLAAVAGLGTVIVHVQPLFQTLKWAGICYLCYLAVGALRSAWTGRYQPLPDPTLDPCPDGAGPERPAPGTGPDRRIGWRQGFLSNITNPKVLVFYLAVLPQFVGAATPVAVLLAFGLSHALLSLAYLLLVVAGLHRVRRLLARRPVRRVLDAVTGTVLLGFGVRLAVEQD